jgi:hypothetical protein
LPCVAHCCAHGHSAPRTTVSALLRRASRIDTVGIPQQQHYIPHGTVGAQARVATVECWCGARAGPCAKALVRQAEVPSGRAQLQYPLEHPRVPQSTAEYRRVPQSTAGYRRVPQSTVESLLTLGWSVECSVSCCPTLHGCISHCACVFAFASGQTRAREGAVPTARVHRGHRQSNPVVPSRAIEYHRVASAAPSSLDSGRH